MAARGLEFTRLLPAPLAVLARAAVQDADEATLGYAAYLAAAAALPPPLPPPEVLLRVFEGAAAASGRFYEYLEGKTLARFMRGQAPPGALASTARLACELSAAQRRELVALVLAGALPRGVPREAAEQLHSWASVHTR